MADENTTGSEVTTETVTPPTGTVPPASTDTSTTEPKAAPTEEAPTILTEGSGEAAPEGESTKEGEETPAENAELFGAPEGSYEIEGLPEGMTVDEAALTAVEPIARQLGLSNKGMSALAGVYAEQILPKVAEQFHTSLQEDIAAQHTAWATETMELIKTDPVFESKPLKEIQQVSAKALDRLGSPELRKFLEETGLGNHPAMLKFAYQAGAAISEDTTFERGGTPPAKPKSSVEKFYGPTT